GYLIWKAAPAIPIGFGGYCWNRNLVKLFVYWQLEDRDPPPAQTELISDLLWQYHLLRDDIQNFVTQANLLAYDRNRLLPVWKAAADERSVLNVPMRELIKADKVIASEGSSKVFIVENSGVFSALLD